jgi:transcriptional regulator PpsR
VKAFKAPTQSLGGLNAETAANVIETATDIALVVDGDGVIQDVAFQRTDLSVELGGYGKWLGRPWIDTVTAESKPKITALLQEASTKRKSGWRQLHHQSLNGGDVPVLYATVRLGRANRYVALGRDLRDVAELQRKLIEAQMSMERDYARLRQIEARYRLLFQLSREPVLIIDANSHKTMEANPAAIELFGNTAKRIIGRNFPESFDAESTERLRLLLSDLRAVGRSTGDVRARLTNSDKHVVVTASLFRQDVASMILIRLAPATDNPMPDIPSAGAKLLKLAEYAPDGLVVTDRDARIESANAAFAEMAQLTGEEIAHGEALERWLGRPGIDLNILIANLRQNEPIRMFSTILRGEYGATTDVEVSAVPLQDDNAPGFGFAIRDVGRRLSPNARSDRELPRSADQLTELIGRVPLKDLVRETTDVIERLCIEAALNLTGDNRASAAEMLGVSRQSLYVKLRRFGLADATDENESSEQ